MATDLTNLNVSATVFISALAEAELELSVPKDDLNVEFTLTSAFGDGADENDQIWHDQRTLAPGANEVLDLNALVNAFGSTANFETVKLVYIKNVEAASGSDRADIEIGAGGSDVPANPFVGWFMDGTSGEILGPDNVMLHTDWYDGWPTVGANQLRIENTSGSESATYDIVIIGINA